MRLIISSRRIRDSLGSLFGLGSSLAFPPAPTPRQRYVGPGLGGSAIFQFHADLKYRLHRKIRSATCGRIRSFDMIKVSIGLNIQQTKSIAYSSNLFSEAR